MNFFKNKVGQILNPNGYNNKSYFNLFTNKLKRKAMTPFIYLGGIIFGYYFLKYLYHRQLYKLGSGSVEDKLDRLIKITEENNRLQKENKALLEKLYYR
jgi:hypothetical protein